MIRVLGGTNSRYDVDGSWSIVASKAQLRVLLETLLLYEKKDWTAYESWHVSNSITGRNNLVCQIQIVRKRWRSNFNVKSCVQFLQ